MAFTPAIVTRALGDLANLVRALALTGDGLNTGDIGGQVYTELEEERLAMTMPAVLLTLTGKAPREDRSSFVADFVSYLVRVQVLDDTKSVQQFQAALPVYLGWYEAIAYAIRGRCIVPVLTSTPEAFDLRVSNEQVVNKQMNKGHTIALEFGILVKTARVRVKTSG